MNNQLKFLILSISFAMVSLIACTDDGGNGGSDDGFDRKKMLENWSDDLIIPSLIDFQTYMFDLNQKAAAFDQSPTLFSLEALQNAWSAAYIKWQYVSMFDIGRAEEIDFRHFMNVYPTDADKIQSNIASGNYDLSSVSLQDEQGFPALDYLLFGLAETNEGVLNFYTNHEMANAYKGYLTAVTQRMESLTDEVVTDWQGGFRNEFVENTTGSATGSVDKLVNDYLFYYEKHLRAGKVGIPAGVFSDDELPTHVEALYKKDLSKTLLLSSLDAVQHFFQGKAYNSSTKGESLLTYLDFVNATKDGMDLSMKIDNQFDIARTTIQNLNDNFNEQIASDNIKMLQAYDALQLNVVMLKVDMLQALDINIDYVDADGD